MRDTDRNTSHLPASASAPDQRALLVSDGPDVEGHLRSLRAALVDRVLLGLLGISFLATPASVLRSVHTGWLPLYTLHVGVAVAILAVFLARRHLPQSGKIAFILAVYWSVGTIGMLNLGLMSAGAWWLVISALLCSLLFSVRVGVAVMAATIAFVGLVGYGYVSGALEPVVVPDLYLRQSTSWLTLAMGTFVMPMIIFGVVAGMQATTVSLLREVDEQRRSIQRLATHDELTGAPTLTLARDRLEQAIRNSRRDHRKVAIYYLDLDGFKAVNDSAGHEAGDEVLRTVVARLRRIVRAEDTIARLGGDEFLAILDNFEFARDVANKADAMLATIAEPIEFRGQSLRVGVSIGIALFPEHAVTAGTLIEIADAAMYQAKRSGRNRVRIATPT